MTPEEGIAQLARQFKSFWLRVPLIVGNTAVNFTLDNFRRQGFLGDTFEPWLPRKQGWGKKVRTGANILIGIGRLRRSIRITRLSPDVVAIGSDVPYARVHNEGLRLGEIQTVKGFTRKNGLAVKAHTRKIDQKIPRRQYMGRSQYMMIQIRRDVSLAFMKENTRT